MTQTGTNHCNSRLLKIFTFRETIPYFRPMIFSQSPRFQFWSPIFDGLCVSFIGPPGIDSWVQPRLNLVFSWVLNPANLGEPSKQVTQVSCVLEPSLPSLAGFIKTNKKPGFSWVCWVRCESNVRFIRTNKTLGFS